MKYYLLSLRPKQWTKNLLIFAALIFSKNLTNKILWLKTIEGFFLFSFLAGHVYIINDLIDREKDRLHPKKKNRPIASGKFPVKTAIFITAIAIPFLLFFSYYLLGKAFFSICIIYFLLQLFYSLWLKNIVIADVMVISIGFLLRALAGVLIINVPISHWLLLCSFLLALFLALSKRRSELSLLEKGKLGKTRRCLQFYSLHFLDQLIAATTAATIISYALYTIDNLTIKKFKTDKLILTLPFVIYGLFRYLYLMYQYGEGESPEQVLLTDKPTYINLIIWLVAVIILIFK